MKTHIYIVRHGITEWNEQGKLQGRLPGIFLSSNGVAQVERTASYLRDKQIDQVITSPLERTKQTGEIINKYHNAPLETDDDFNEWQMDKWQGYLFDELQHHFPEEFVRWRKDPSDQVDFGGETLEYIAERSYKGLNKYVQKYPGKNLLIVSHGDTIRALICKLVNIPLANLRCFEITNAAVTTLIWNGTDYILESLNIIPE